MRFKAMFPSCEHIAVALKAFSQKYTLIRVKNKLQTETRDILVNFYYDDKTPCEA
jgi:hypothetical protein